MKAILFIALIAILTTGLATADPVDMTIYDRNNDMQIDAAERMILDIDIQSSRISQAEAYVIDSYTVDGTVLLDEELRLAFLNPEAYPRNSVVSVTVTDEPTIPVEVPESTPTVSETQPADDDVKSNMTIVVMVCAILIVGIIAYIYSRQGNEDE